MPIKIFTEKQENKLNPQIEEGWKRALMDDSGV